MTDRLLTRPQVADLFQISPRHLQDLEKQHSIQPPRLGRAVRYDTATILQLKAAFQCPSRSTATAPLALGKSSGQLPGNASGNLRGRLTAGSRKKPGPNSKPASTVVPFLARGR